MAKKKQLSLLQQQKAKLKRQRALTANPKTRQLLSRKIQQVQVRIVNTQKALTGSKPAKALPPSKKGGPIKSTRSPRRTNVNKPPTTKPQVGTRGGGIKPQLRLPPAGRTAANLLKNNAVARAAGSKLGGIGLALSGIATAQDLAAQLKRGEGYASLPRLARAIAKGKPKKTSGGTTNRRGRSRSTTTTKPTNNTPNKTGSTSTPSKYPTKANLVTRKASRDYQAEAKSKATSTPKTKSSPTPKAKTDNRSTLTKEIDGLTKFLATHKGKKGMERALTQARKSLAAKKKKRSQRSTTMSGTLPSNRNSA